MHACAKLECLYDKVMISSIYSGTLVVIECKASSVLKHLVNTLKWIVAIGPFSWMGMWSSFHTLHISWWNVVIIKRPHRICNSLVLCKI